MVRGNLHASERQGHVAGYRLSGGCLAADGFESPAGQPDGQRGNAATHPADRQRAQLQGRQERIEPAPPAVGHARPAVLRGPDARRFADQSVLPVDAGLADARLCAAGLRPADLVPAAVQQLAHGLRGQQEGRRHHPARLRRLPRIPQAPGPARRARHALRALGRGAARTSPAFRSAATTCRAAAT